MSERTSYHLEQGGELVGFTSRNDRHGCQVEEFRTIGGRTVRFTVRHDVTYSEQSSARAEYWDGGHWVPLADVPTFFPAGSGTTLYWTGEKELTEPIESEHDQITLGAQTALAELWSRAQALLAPASAGSAPDQTLGQIRDLLTGSDWSGVLYDNDVLGAIAECVGVERQD